MFYELDYALNVVFESTWRPALRLISTGIAVASLAVTELVLLLSFGATHRSSTSSRGMRQDSGDSISWPSQPTICFSPIRFPLRWPSSRSWRSIGSFHDDGTQWREAMIGALTFSLLWIAAEESPCS